MSDQLTPQDFAARIRAKYPGAYDDLDDYDLTSRVLKKYPGYATSIASGPAAPAPPVGLQGPPDAPDDRHWFSKGLISGDTIQHVMNTLAPAGASNHAGIGAQALAHQVAPATVPAVAATPKSEDLDTLGTTPLAQFVSDQTSPSNLFVDAALAGGGAAAGGLRGAAARAVGDNPVRFLGGATAAKWLNRGAKVASAVDRGTSAAIAGEGALNAVKSGAQMIQDPAVANATGTALGVLQAAGGAYGATRGFYSPRMAEPNSYMAGFADDSDFPVMTRGQFAQRLTDPERGTPLRVDLAQATESPALIDAKSVLQRMPGSRGVMARNAKGNLKALGDRLKADLNTQPESVLSGGEAPAYRGMGSAVTSEPAAVVKQIQTGIGPDGQPIMGSVKAQTHLGNPAEQIPQLKTLGDHPPFRSMMENASNRLGDYLENPIDTKTIPWGVAGLLTSPAIWSFARGNFATAARELALPAAAAGVSNLAARAFTNPAVVNWLTTAAPAGERAAAGAGTAAIRGLRQQQQQQQ